MTHKRPARKGNPDRRRHRQMPTVAIAEIETRLYSMLSPESFKPLKEVGVEGKRKRRARLLSLPVMVAIVLSLVYRRIPSLSEAVRVLELEGLLWVEPLKVSKQALSKRLSCLPTKLFAQILEQVLVKIRSLNSKRPPPAGWESVYPNFQALWIADGSTQRFSTLAGLTHSQKVKSFL